MFGVKPTSHIKFPTIPKTHDNPRGMTMTSTEWLSEDKEHDEAWLKYQAHHKTLRLDENSSDVFNNMYLRRVLILFCTLFQVFGYVLGLETCNVPTPLSIWYTDSRI